MRLIHALKKDRGGNVLMLTGLAILILFATAGAGIDFGRQQLVHMKLQNASDAAAIAAASMPESTSAEQRRAVALRYYNLNFPISYLGVDRPTPNIQIGSQIIVDASVNLNANFVSNVGVEQLSSQGRTVVDRSQAQNSIYDVILVMDNSNSMSFTLAAPAYAETPQGERQNARNQIDLRCRATQANLIQRGACAPQLPLLRPFPIMPNGYGKQYLTENQCRSFYAVEFCNAMNNGENPLNGPGTNDDGFGYSFTGNTRLNALRKVALDFVTRIIDEGEQGSRLGLVMWGSEVLRSRTLINTSATVRQEINSMAGWGGTNPVAAMNRAIEIARDFNPSHVKAVVLLSDGAPTQVGTIQQNNVDSSGCNGRNYCAAAANQTLPLCTQLKNSGVQVYTIGFLDPNDPYLTAAERVSAANFLRSCASVDAQGRPRYYSAPTGVELDQAFTQILVSLGRIRIAQ